MSERMFFLAGLITLAACYAPNESVSGPSEGLSAGAVGRPALSSDDALAELATVYADRASAAGFPVDGLPIRYTAGGQPRALFGPGFRLPASVFGATSATPAREVADALVHRYASLWGVPPSEFAVAAVRERRHTALVGTSIDKVTYAQLHEGHAVVGAEITVLVEAHSRDIVGVMGTFIPFDSALPSPTIAATDAAGRVGPTAVAGDAVIWSGLLDGTAASPRLAWDVVTTDAEGARADAYVDAVTGERLHGVNAWSDSLRRALTDARSNPVYYENDCQKWSNLYVPYPAVLSGCTRSACVACTTDKQQCARCVCEAVGVDPAGCETYLYQYDELSGGCFGNGDPVGEPAGPCSTDALQLWNDAGSTYSYWLSAFGRDGWNGTGGWQMLRANVNRAGFPAGRTQPRYVGTSLITDYPLVQSTIYAGAANAVLDGHELGHALQYGSYGYNGQLGFYGQTTDVTENHADIHAFRYRGLPLPTTGTGYDCSTYDNVHYDQYRAIPDLDTNKRIGNCHAWMLTRSGAPYYFHGINVSPIVGGTYDPVWYRALDVYLTGGNDYFDWWNEQITAAYDLYGVGSATFQSFVQARNAVGGWTANAPLISTAGAYLGTLPGTTARLAAVGPTASSTRTPCIFFRKATDTPTVYWTCRESAGWRPPSAFNSSSVDPAGSDPAATFRWFGGKYIVYVFWKGSADSRIHYRTLDTSTYAVSGPADMGATFLTAGAVAAAPVYESGSQDRVVVMFHPAANPRYFYGTYLGSTSYTDMGGAFDSAIAPALVAFPYYNRVYFVRPDDTTGHNIRYASYTLTGGWDLTSRSISDMYSGLSGEPAGVVSSDYPVALAEFERDVTPHLRMMFTTTTGTTGGQRELWYATLKEASPGVLIIDIFPLYRAVPMAPATANYMQSPVALTADGAGTTLWNFWGGGSYVSAWQSFSD